MKKKKKIRILKSINSRFHQAVAMLLRGDEEGARSLLDPLYYDRPDEWVRKKKKDRKKDRTKAWREDESNTRSSAPSDDQPKKSKELSANSERPGGIRPLNPVAK